MCAAARWSDGTTPFIMRSAIDTTKCLGVPPDEGGQFLLLPCDSASDNQKLLAQPLMSIGNPLGRIVSYARQSFVLCDTLDSSYKWTSAGCSSPGDTWWFLDRSERLMSTSGRSFSVDVLRSSVVFGLPDQSFLPGPSLPGSSVPESSPAWSWTVEIP